MENYIVRQPIFNMEYTVKGYEVLFDQSQINQDEFTELEEVEEAFITFISSLDFDEISFNTKAYININENFLINRDFLLFPRHTTVLVISSEFLRDPEMVESIREIQKQKYSVVIDVKNNDIAYLGRVLPDVIRMDMDATDLILQEKVIQFSDDTIEFSAMNVNTHEQFEQAKNLGYSYFQGDFFSQPLADENESIKEIPGTYLKILNEVKKEEPSYEKLTRIIEKDLGLTYKILKTVNSVYYASRYKINSIEQALIRMGIDEIKKWAYIMILKKPVKVEQSELVKICLIRGKFMELLAKSINLEKKSSEFFLAGILSSIDVLMNCQMSKIVSKLMLADDVREALLGKHNIIKEAMDLVVNYEKAEWEAVEKSKFMTYGTIYNIINLYLLSLNWADNIEE
ncbi:MAG: HDOD domain-containing protein [Clostridia bacterium]|nr:HDOD domain-containing protein [Clostridia bacterium]